MFHGLFAMGICVKMETLDNKVTFTGIMRCVLELAQEVWPQEAWMDVE